VNVVHKDIQIDVEARIRRIIGRKKRLSLATELYHDLQISGDDASALLEEIAKEYLIDFDGFEFSEYLPNEYEALWYYLKARIGVRDSRRKPFTIGHLIAVAERHAWFEETTR
jgi:Protein of unknown function (DUF1493)